MALPLDTKGFTNDAINASTKTGMLCLCHIAFDRQQRLDRCDEIIPILAVFKHVYAQPKLRKEILNPDFPSSSLSFGTRFAPDPWNIGVFSNFMP